MKPGARRFVGAVKKGDHQKQEKKKTSTEKKKTGGNRMLSLIISDEKNLKGTDEEGCFSRQENERSEVEQELLQRHSRRNLDCDGKKNPFLRKFQGPVIRHNRRKNKSGKKKRASRQ